MFSAGCGGDAATTIETQPPPLPPGPVVNGTVSLPNGRLARLERSVLQRFAALVVEEAEALTANIRPVGRQVAVQLTHRRADGTTQSLDTAFTNDQGQYLITLPSGTSEDTCRFIVSVGDGSTLTRAFVTSASAPVNIDFVSETAVFVVLGRVDLGANLCDFSTEELRDLVNAIRRLPGDVSGANVFEVNRSALIAAASDPGIQQMLDEISGRPTPVATRTPLQPTATVPPTITATFTATRTVTVTRTPVPSNTPATPPPPSATRTRTATAAPSNTRTPTQTATRPPFTATPTHTATPPPTFTPTSTNTPAATPPHITIGSVSGAPSAEVTVPISLTKNEFTIVTIAPLIFEFDPAVLTFGNCTSKVDGKNVDFGSPSTGRISIVMSGGLGTIPDDAIIDCTFTIDGGAAPDSSTTLAFVRAGMADADTNDVEGTGSNGSVTVAGAPTETPTETETPTPSATPTTGATPPHITLGNASGAPGSEVMVPISLTKNGPNIVTIAPLVITFDAGVLSFGSCAKTAEVSSGKSVNAATPQAGRITVALSGDLETLPDGDILQCTFTIAAEAAAGETPLTFQSAGLADDQFNDYEATGTNGSVTITGGEVPTATPTMVVARPQISIGSASGEAGSEVTVAIALTKNGPNIVTIAPLVLTFDTNVLTFGSCTKTAGVSGGKSVNAAQPQPGRLTIALSGDLAPIPDGDVLNCTFTISAGAAAGSTALTFQSAGLADDQFNDFDAGGTSGTVTVGGEPTATPTPTATSPAGPASALLASPIGAADITIPVNDVSQFPDSGTVLIGLELISYNGKQVTAGASGFNGGAAAAQPGALLNVQRGVNGTTAQAHSANEVVTLVPSGASIITIGNASGEAGSQVTVPVALVKGGLNIVTIAPLVVTFDAGVLTFGSCTKTAAVSAGKSVNAAMPQAGRVTIALSGDLVVVPDGDILNCTFTINAGAPGGSTPLTFVSAGLSDDQFNDSDATGLSGAVMVGAVVPPTLTPTVAVPTPTPTLPPAGPHITIGNVSGAAGSQVTVPISLAKNGPSIVTIAPLVMTFDTNVLTFGSCTKAAAVSGGKSVNAAQPQPGRLTIALSGDLVPLADGEVLSCSFTINAAAPSGSTALTFQSAGLADDQFNDFDASGTSGSVMVGGGETPTPTVAPTATPTVAATGPQITIGSASGAAGSQVTVPISLANNGPSIVTIAPLVVTFDANVLTFSNCTKAAGVSGGKSVNAATPMPGRVSIALSGDLVPIPDGEVLSCTFTINAGAAAGSTSLTFQSAGLADDQFNDYDASGTHGSVTVE